jgi:hypothetical protein
VGHSFLKILKQNGLPLFIANEVNIVAVGADRGL